VSTATRWPAARRRQPEEAYASATAFGTFGELLQGALPDSGDFLVTLPIARWSMARFLLDPGAVAVHVRPAHKTKSRQLAESMLSDHGFTNGGVLMLDSDLPEGKGLASSSADLVATARAVGRAIEDVPGPADIEALLRPIEPTDGVMYEGVVAFHHRAVRLRTSLGHLPPMTVVGVDEGGEIETVDFNKRPKGFTAAHKRTYAELLTTITQAIRVADVSAIGEVATRSAQMNQRLCPKRGLEEMIQISRDVGGVGVVAAHSGTTLGVLLENNQPGHTERLERTKQACFRLAGRVWVDHCLPSAPGPGPHSQSGYLPPDHAVPTPAGPSRWLWGEDR
jgi:uncharacterized protein involved in propanediol utilization